MVIPCEAGASATGDRPDFVLDTNHGTALMNMFSGPKFLEKTCKPAENKSPERVCLAGNKIAMEESTVNGQGSHH